MVEGETNEEQFARATAECDLAIFVGEAYIAVVIGTLGGVLLITYLSMLLRYW